MDKDVGGQVFKFDGTNCSQWKNQMKIVLEGRDLFDVVDRSNSLGEAQAEGEADMWKTKNNLAKWIITTSVNMEHLNMIIN